jgi:copper chaperone CopZ
MKVAGVTKVDVSFEEKQAVVAGSACDPGRLIASLSQAGYRAHVK